MPRQLPENIDEPAVFREGIKLFNEGEWFEAHEVWEDIWVLASGEKKLYYQGLIQAAVVLEHCRRGNPRGVRAVYNNYLKKFVGLPDVYMGIDIKKLDTELKQCIDPVLNLPDSYFDPAKGRGLDIPFDPQAAPLIALEYDPFENSAEEA